MAWTTGPDYGLLFSYDGFGNKLSQTVTKGTAPSMSITVDANNRVTGQTYDLNGNMTVGAASTLTYDMDNRVATAATRTVSRKRRAVSRPTGSGCFTTARNRSPVTTSGYCH